MRIFVTSGYSYWGAFRPTDLRDPNATNQIGGGETAMVSIARELAARGHEVTVFHDLDRPGRYEGVQYLPARLFPDLATLMEHDVLVAWDSSHAFRYCDRAKVRILAFQLNDALIGVFDHVVDRYFHPSAWHAQRFKQLYPEIRESAQRWTLTNGIDLRRYAQEVERNHYRVIYSSSPDRGLHHLLRFWPRIKELVPEAELHVFYDIDRWTALTFQLEQMGLVGPTTERAHLVAQARENPPEGVTFRGGIGQWQLAREQLGSALMVYPCDPTQPTEGFSMSCLEGVVAGCTLITSNADALPELWTSAPDATLLPLPVDDDVWVATIVDKLLHQRERAALAPDTTTWPALARVWEEEILACLNNQGPQSPQ